MQRPFEAVGAIFVGFLVYAFFIAVYHISTATPVNWTLSFSGAAGFAVGAYLTRNLWH
jgi:hypothetical protein